MPWWGWLLVFAAILLLGSWWLWVRVRHTWRSVTAVNRQLSASAAVVREAGATSPAGAAVAPELAVFTHPYEAYRQRTEIRATLAAERQARRAAKLPPWARR